MFRATKLNQLKFSSKEHTPKVKPEKTPETTPATLSTMEDMTTVSPPIFTFGSANISCTPILSSMSQFKNKAHEENFLGLEVLQRSNNARSAMTLFIKGRVKLWKRILTYVQFSSFAEQELRAQCKVFKYAFPRPPPHVVVPSRTYPTLRHAVTSLQAWCQRKQQKILKIQAAKKVVTTENRILNGSRIVVTFTTVEKEVHYSYSHSSLQVMHTGQGTVVRSNKDDTFDVRLDCIPLSLQMEQNENGNDDDNELWLDQVPLELLRLLPRNEDKMTSTYNSQTNKNKTYVVVHNHDSPSPGTTTTAALALPTALPHVAPPCEIWLECGEHVIPFENSLSDSRSVKLDFPLKIRGRASGLTMLKGGVLIGGQSDTSMGVVLSDLTLTNPTGNGITMDSATSQTLLVENCEITKCLLNGVASFKNSQNPSSTLRSKIILVDCQVHHNKENGIHLQSGCLRGNDSVIHHNSKNGIKVESGATADLYGKTTRVHHNGRPSVSNLGDPTADLNAVNLKTSTNSAGTGGFSFGGGGYQPYSNNSSISSTATSVINIHSPLTKVMVDQVGAYSFHTACIGEVLQDGARTTSTAANIFGAPTTVKYPTPGAYSPAPPVWPNQHKATKPALPMTYYSATKPVPVSVPAEASSGGFSFVGAAPAVGFGAAAAAGFGMPMQQPMNSYSMGGIHMQQPMMGMGGMQSQTMVGVQ